MSEKKLVEAVLKGDPKAQERFYAEYKLYLYRTCVHFLGCEDSECEDLVHDVLVIAIQKLDRFDFKFKLRTWLTQICINLCFERLRERKRIQSKLQEEIESITRKAALDLDRKRISDEDKKQKLEVIEKQKRFVGDKCRQVLDLRDSQGKSYIEMSRILKIPIGSVMSRLARCRDGLKRLVLAVIGEAG